jgi:hypothetical protein
MRGHDIPFATGIAIRIAALIAADFLGPAVADARVALNVNNAVGMDGWPP